MPPEEEVSHHEIYQRLLAVETKVDSIASNTEHVVAAFNAAAGAFTVLEWLARLAKPILWIGGLVAAAGTLISHLKDKT